MRSKFIYWLMLLYIPFGCILYNLNIGFINLQYYDEITTLALLIYTLYNVIIKRCSFCRESYLFGAVALFYLLYSVLYQNIRFNVAVYDLQQQAKPYIVFYCFITLKPFFSSVQKRNLRRVAIASGAFLLFSFFATGAHIESTYLFGMSGGSIATTALAAGILYYALSDKDKHSRTIFVIIISIGLLGGKSKMFGEYFAIMLVLFFLHRHLRMVSLRTLLVVMVLVVGGIYVAWDKFNYYYVEGLKNEEIARPMMYKAGIDIICDYFPFGSGLGTFGTEASRQYYSHIYYDYGLWNIYGLQETNASFAADAYFPSLAEFGIVGVMLFILFWVKRYKNFRSYPLVYYKIGLFLFIVLIGDAIADSSYVSNRGVMMWALMGLLVSGSLKRMDGVVVKKK